MSHSVSNNQSNGPGITLTKQRATSPCCSRYDYEGVDSGDAGKVMDTVRKVISESKKGTKFGPFTLDFADDFEYTDPIDGSKASRQGLRFVFDDASRIIFRLSGTGSAGATIRYAPTPSLPSPAEPRGCR